MGVLLDASFGQEFINLFMEMHWVVILLLTLGVCLLIIEAAIPGFGFFGVTGILCEIGAVIAQAIFSRSVAQVFYMILLIVGITLLLFGIFVHSARKGILRKTPFVEDKTAIPVDYNNINKSPYKDLIGKFGKVTVDCRPIGQVVIDGKFYEVHSESGLLKEGTGAVVKNVVGDTIYIEKSEGVNELEKLKKKGFFNKLFRRGDKK